MLHILRRRLATGTVTSRYPDVPEEAPPAFRGMPELLEGACRGAGECATVCPTQAIFYGTYEEWLLAGRGQQGAKPVNTFYFGRQKVRTRNYVVMTHQDEALDLLSLVEEADFGRQANIPAPTATSNAESWVEADLAGIPQRTVPPHPWTPRQPQPQPEPART